MSDDKTSEMTDRELLELAAKAAGVGRIEYAGGDFYRQIIFGKYQTWNPIDDDGDALRLAVSLGLNVDVHRQDPFQSAFVEVRGYALRRMLADGPAADNGESLAAATRRAIVRAAAEIGKAMP